MTEGLKLLALVLIAVSISTVSTKNHLIKCNDPKIVASLEKLTSGYKAIRDVAPFLMMDLVREENEMNLHLKLLYGDGRAQIKFSLVLKICRLSQNYIFSSDKYVFSCNYANDTVLIEDMELGQHFYITLTPSDAQYPMIKVINFRYLALDSSTMKLYDAFVSLPIPMNQLEFGKEHYNKDSSRLKRDTSEQGYIIVTNGDKIHQVSLDGSRNQILISNLSHAVGIDYDYRRNVMYWTDKIKGAIMRSSLDGSSMYSLLAYGLISPEDVAVDWINNKVYFTDSALQIVGVFDPVSLVYTILVHTGPSSKPFGIVVDPSNRELYWTIIEGSEGRIERASLDGKNKSTIIQQEEMSGIHGLTLDIEEQTLYWIDSVSYTIASVKVNGSNRTLIGHYGFEFSIAKDNNVLYFSDYNLYSVTLDDNNRLEILSSLRTCFQNRFSSGLTVVKMSHQPISFNPCGYNNGGCSHMCLLSSASATNFSCICPDGMELEGESNCSPLENGTVLNLHFDSPGSCVLAGHFSCCNESSSCQGSPPNCYCDANCHLFEDCCNDVPDGCRDQKFLPYIAISEGNFIHQIDVVSSGRSRTMISNINNSYSIDYHYRLNTLFWTDNSEYPSIWRSNLDGTGAIPMVTSNISSPVGIAVDWISDKIYWSDSIDNTINVLDIITGHHMVLFHLDDAEPHDIVLDSNSRYLFWADYNTLNDSGRILKSSLDGRNGFETILDMSGGRPSISIDYKRQLLYFSQRSLIGYIRTDGTGDQIISSIISENVNFISILNDRTLFYYEYATHSILTLDINGTMGQIVNSSVDKCYGFFGSKVISEKRQTTYGVNPCGLNNGGCSDLCLLSSVDPRNYTCACHNSTSLSPNQMNCSENFTVPLPPIHGTCMAAGFNSCCNEGDCRGSPPTCNCDSTCEEFKDCCSDAFSLCQIHFTGNEALQFLIRPNETTTFKFEEISLFCSFQSTYSATIEWFYTQIGTKLDKLVANNDEMSFLPQYSVVLERNGLTLIIHNAVYSRDQGVYTCKVKSNQRTISASANVNIISSPTVKVLGSNRFSEASPSKLQCVVMGNPPPRIVWLKRSENEVTVILNTTRTTITNEYSDITAITTNSIIINRTLPSDHGEYICEARNGLPPSVRATKRVVVTVINDCSPEGGNPCANNGVCIDLVGGYSCVCPDSFIGSKCEVEIEDGGLHIQPRIDTPPNSIEADLITTVNLTCTAEGFPPPRYQWLKGDEPITGETNQSLLIEKVEPEDRGNYTCVVSNREGESFSTPAQLDIPGEGLPDMQLLDLLLMIVNTNIPGTQSSIYSVKILNGTSLMEKITLLVTMREPRDAKTPVNYLRGSFISLLDTFSLVNVESVRRYDGCEERTYEGFEWPETDVGKHASVACPCEEFIGVLSGRAFSSCDGNYISRAHWNNVIDTSGCVALTSKITSALCQAAENAGNVSVEVAADVVNVTSDTDLLRASDISAVASIIDLLTSEAITNPEVRNNYFKIVDNVQQASSEEVLLSQRITRSSQRLLDNMARLVDSLEIVSTNTSNKTIVFGFDTFAVILKDLEPQAFKGQILYVNLGSLEDALNSSRVFEGDSLTTSEMINTALNQSTAVLQLPDSLVNGCGFDNDSSNITELRLSYSVFLKDILFQSQNSSMYEIGSIIVSVRLNCAMNSTLAKPLTIGFRTKNEIQQTASKGSCGIWDPESDEFGAWSTSGCRNVTRNGNHTICECSQLGHFGMLFDLNPRPPPLEVALALFIITYVGIIISLLCLTVLVLTYMCSSKLRSNTHSQILINMSIALGGVYISFITGGHVTAIPILCGFSSAFLHYFMLVFFAWTAMETIWLYLKLVRVFGTHNYFILKSGILAWIIPLLVVLISIGPGYQYYKNKYYCRVTEWPFWFGFLLPFLLIYVFDWIMFIIILGSIMKRKTNTSQDAYRRNKENFIIALSLAVVFGLGWGLGLLATSNPVEEVTIGLQVLFSIFVGAQGVLLFILHGIRNTDSRKLWKRCFFSMRCTRLLLTVISSKSTARSTSYSSNGLHRHSQESTLPRKTEFMNQIKKKESISSSTCIPEQELEGTDLNVNNIVKLEMHHANNHGEKSELNCAVPTSRRDSNEERKQEVSNDDSSIQLNDSSIKEFERKESATDVTNKEHGSLMRSMELNWKTRLQQM